MITILDWLIEIRKQNNISRTNLAKKIGVSRQAIWTYEAETRKVPVDTAKLIAAALNFNWHKFYDDTPSENGDNTA